MPKQSNRRKLTRISVLATAWLLLFLFAQASHLIGHVGQIEDTDVCTLKTLHIHPGRAQLDHQDFCDFCGQMQGFSLMAVVVAPASLPVLRAQTVSAPQQSRTTEPVHSKGRAPPSLPRNLS